MCAAKAALGILCVQFGRIRKQPGCTVLHLPVLMLCRGHSVIQRSGRMGDFRGAQLAALKMSRQRCYFNCRHLGSWEKMAHGSKCRDRVARVLDEGLRVQKIEEARVYCTLCISFCGLTWGICQRF